MFIFLSYDSYDYILYMHTHSQLIFLELLRAGLWDTELDLSLFKGDVDWKEDRFRQETNGDGGSNGRNSEIAKRVAPEQGYLL